MKTASPSNIIDYWTSLEVLLRIKLNGHADTLTEASNLLDDLNKKGEIQNEEQCRNSLNKIYSIRTELPIKLVEQIPFNTRL